MPLSAKNAHKIMLRKNLTNFYDLRYNRSTVISPNSFFITMGRCWCSKRLFGFCQFLYMSLSNLGSTHSQFQMVLPFYFRYCQSVANGWSFTINYNYVCVCVSFWKICHRKPFLCILFCYIFMHRRGIPYLV